MQKGTYVRSPPHMEKMAQKSQSKPKKTRHRQQSHADTGPRSPRIFRVEKHQSHNQNGDKNPHMAEVEASGAVSRPQLEPRGKSAEGEQARNDDWLGSSGSPAQSILREGHRER